MKSLISAIEAIDDIEVYGRVKSVQGLLIEIVGPVRELRVGGRVQIETVNDEQLAAESLPEEDVAAGEAPRARDGPAQRQAFEQQRDKPASVVRREALSGVNVRQ